LTGADSPRPSETSPSQLSTAQASVLAFLTAGTTLALQILIHRIVSAKLLNNYAFLVISLTMLGFAISGVVLTALQRRVMRRMPEAMLLSACLLAVSAVVATALFASAAVSTEELHTRAALVRSFLQLSPYALLLTIPFGFAGFMLGALLSDERLPTRRVYFCDLLGSAAGALIVLPLFRYVGVEAMIVAFSLLLMAGVALVVPPKTSALRVLSVLSCALLLLALNQRKEIFSIYYPERSMLAATRNRGTGVVLEYTEWDPLARIEISAVPGLVPQTGVFASLFGENRTFLLRYRKLITQNNFAFTYGVDYDGRPESLFGIEETIYASAYYASSVKKPKVAAIGVGGGFDILTALHFDVTQVTGIEINAATLNVLRNVFKDYFHHWVDDPRVNLVNAEGRHYLSTHPERFDIIQLSGVDSYSGTPGAAHVFSENYLYTAEAFDLYLSRLSEDGVLNMMRLEHRPAREMLRALTTAVAALRRLGVTDPKRHIVTVTENTGFFTAMLVKRTPFSEAELQRLREWTSQRPTFGISAEPGSSNSQRTNAYQYFLSLGDERLERLFIQAYPFAIDPALDDRPFFFNFSFWWHLLPGQRMFPGQGPSWIYVPVLQMSLVVLAAAVSLVMVIAIFFPLAFLLRHGLPTAGRNRFGVYCAGAAIGYLAAEVALMQLFGLFLGHPNYAISVVLAALLFSSGLGSLWAAAIVGRLKSVRSVAYLLSAIIFAEYFLVFPWLSSLLGLPFAVRVFVTAALVFPIGVCLGVFLPTALDLLKQRSPHLVPWAWGVNGVFSVLAPLLAVAIATTFGISALLLSTVPVYLLVAFSLPETPDPPSLETTS
jgi:spermidine synthase